MKVVRQLSDVQARPSWIAAPRVLLGVMAALIASSIVMAGVARSTGVGAARLDEPEGGQSADLRFEDGPAGTIRVVDITGARAPLILHPGKDGFVRVALRSLARDRRASGSGAEIPVRLGRLDNGRLWLRDLATGRTLYLDAYGQENARSFAQLLEPRLPQSPSRSND